MGQAKQRGTRDDRIVQAIERDHAAAVERERQEQQRRAAEETRVAALPPTARRKHVQTRTLVAHRHLLLASLVALASAPLLPAKPGDPEDSP